MTERSEGYEQSASKAGTSEAAASCQGAERGI